MSGTVGAASRAAFSQKLLDALNDGRKVSSVPISKLPKAAKTDAKSAAKQYDGVDAQKFQYGKGTFYAVRKSAEDAFDVYDFFSKGGKFAGTQEVDF
jgi:hypothetical protein